MTAFVDTNIVVYAHDGADREKQQRAREVLLAHADDLVLSAQVLSETYAVLTRRIGVEPVVVRSIVAELSRFVLVALDGTLVLEAIDTSTAAQLSYWDALIVAAARAGGCDTLFTEDLSDGATIAGVRIVNPLLA